MDSRKKLTSQDVSFVLKKLLCEWETPVICLLNLKIKLLLVYETLEANRTIKKTRTKGDGTVSQPLIVDTFDHVRKLDSFSKEHKELTKYIGIFLDASPIYKVEKEVC